MDKLGKYSYKYVDERLRNLASYFKMFADNISGNILKYDSVSKISKFFIEIFERTFQSVDWKDVLGNNVH